MLALSTSWKSNQVDNGWYLIEALENFEISQVELEYRISRRMYAQMREPLRASRLRVVSIHNYFPLPSDRPDAQGSGDFFSLAHTDKEERRKAVQATIQTIEHANDLEAEAVILHCGYVEMDPEKEKLFKFIERGETDSKEYEAFTARKLSERDQKKVKHLDSLLFSLERLLRVAEKQNIRLGVENRYHYNELPGPEDFRILFREFKGSPLGYWHDTGHAHANEIFGFVSQQDLLKTNAENLIGIHLHDALGIEDHLVPGKGEIDFERIKKLLKPETLRVVELEPATPDADVAEALRFLREKGFG
jgi:sugar phosphate isomerase/epimerase